MFSSWAQEQLTSALRFCHGAFFMGQIHLFLMLYGNNALDMPLEFNSSFFSVNVTLVFLASTYLAQESSIKEIWVTITVVFSSETVQVSLLELAAPCFSLLLTWLQSGLNFHWWQLIIFLSKAIIIQNLALFP